MVCIKSLKAPTSASGFKITLPSMDIIQDLGNATALSANVSILECAIRLGYHTLKSERFPTLVYLQQ